MWSFKKFTQVQFKNYTQVVYSYVRALNDAITFCLNVVYVAQAKTKYFFYPKQLITFLIHGDISIIMKRIQHIECFVGVGHVSEWDSS